MRQAWVSWLSVDYLFPILTLIAAALLASDTRGVGRQKLVSHAVAPSQPVQVNHEFIAAGN